MKSISRRNFIKSAGQGVVMTAMVPAFLKNDMDKAFNLGSSEVLNPQDLKLADFLSRFGISENIIGETLSEALSKGGDFSELFFQHRISNFIALEDNQVNKAYSDIIYGVGIRVLKGDQTGYSYTEEITPEKLKTAARTAAAIASSSKIIAPVQLNVHSSSNYYPILTSWETVTISDKIPYLNRLNEKIFSAEKRIIKVSASISNETSYVLIANSEGRMVYDYRPMISIYSGCTAEQNGKRERGGSNVSQRLGKEFLTDNIIDYLANEAIKDTITKFEAIKPEAGEMEIVLGAGDSGILLHEAMGHGFEADFNRIKTSIFSDKLNQKVAENFVTIIDSGTLPNKRGSINIDDEGNDSKETVLVENGILKSYLHDRISAKFYGVAPTGNGRRETFRHMPMPRMRNTYMANGPHSREEIIASVKKGIYADKFSNGQVNIGAGDFTFYISSGNIIEDGKLGKPIKDVNIIGNGPKVLSKIVMVGNDYKLSEGGWTCGKNGQGAQVSQGMPTVKVSSITVGGVKS